MNSLQGKTAVVTGATRGIGYAIATVLLNRGCSTFITARNKSAVDEAVSQLSRNRSAASGSGVRVAGGACDVRMPDSVSGMMRAAVEELGGLDVLINNAGIGSHSNVADMSIDEWRNTIDTNLSGVFYCCHEAIPRMKQRGGGFIINIGSLAGRNAFPGGSAYNASKFGLIGFSEALMQEVRYDHIRVSCVMPGSVNTSFGRSGVQEPEQTWKLWPEDVAQVVVDLLEMETRALPSIVELRPSEPKK